MRIAGIVESSYVDGPGRRTALFVQGCPIRCRGCQNQRLWAADGGTEFEVAEVAQRLLATELPVTISGGEPFAQVSELAMLLRLLRAYNPALHIILYSGWTLSELLSRPEPAVSQALGIADVLVDGPYVAELDEPGLQYKGSSNQRVIDLRATAQQSGLSGTPSIVTLDWQQPEIVVTAEGDLIGTPEAISALGCLGAQSTWGCPVTHRRCGQTEEV